MGVFLGWQWSKRPCPVARHLLLPKVASAVRARLLSHLKGPPVTHFVFQGEAVWPAPWLSLDEMALHFSLTHEKEDASWGWSAGY